MKNTDIINRLLNNHETVYNKIMCAFYRLFINAEMYLKNIQNGNGNKYYGRVKLKRVNNSTIKIGNNCTFRSLPTSNLIGINHPCIITALTEHANLIIGNNCGFSGTVISCFKEIIIGNNVMCGANTLITDSDWHPEDFRSGAPKPVRIGDNAWIGVNVIILKGVSIGENSVIGAGSVVLKDIPKDVIAAGNPCRIIKDL